MDRLLVFPSANANLVFAVFLSNSAICWWILILQWFRFWYMYSKISFYKESNILKVSLYCKHMYTVLNVSTVFHTFQVRSWLTARGLCRVLHWWSSSCLGALWDCTPCLPQLIKMAANILWRGWSWIHAAHRAIVMLNDPILSSASEHLQK